LTDKIAALSVRWLLFLFLTLGFTSPTSFHY
jgi:hypothetical protein